MTIACVTLNGNEITHEREKKKKCNAVVECFHIDVFHMLFICDSRKNKKENLVHEIFIVFTLRFGKVCWK